jgi:hypothetical protein
MQVMVRYRVRPDELARNLELLRAAYEELESVSPDGLREETYQLDDKVTFVTVVDMAEGPDVLRRLEAFQRYRMTLDQRCDQPPVVTMLHVVGSYRFR